MPLYALSRDDFLAAVTSDAASTRAAESVVSARLSGLEHALGRGGRVEPEPGSREGALD